MNLMQIKKLFGKKCVKISIGIIFIGLYALGMYINYDEYRDTIVAKQQENMLGITRSICRSVELYFESIIDTMESISGDREFIQDINRISETGEKNVILDEFRAYYNSKSELVDRIYFIDSTGKVVSYYPDGSESIYFENKEDIEIALKTRQTHIGRAYMHKDLKIFVVNIFKPVFIDEEFKGVIAISLSLDVIYDNLIAPVKVGQKGYVMVKDQEGIIIMHPVKEQVGMDVIESRKKAYPSLEYQELERLVSEQLEGEEGTKIYHSYWWGDNVLKKTKKLNAYTPLKFGDYFWVVALTTSYEEIADPINKFLLKSFCNSIAIAVIMGLFLIVLFNMKKNKDELEKETKYLKMLNETSEQLRKQEAELYHSQKLKMIGTLAGGIAHDINNLLTPILGYSELLLMGFSEDREEYEEVQEIYKAAQKGKELTQQMLVLARSDSNIIQDELVDINLALKDTLKLLKTLVPKKIVINEYIEQKCGFINISYTQIHQVLFNLCTNAYQSMDGSGVMEVSLKVISGKKAQQINSKLSARKDYAEIIIKDSGCGMDEETLARIFEPFFTTKEIGDGTGLGLFVVQSIIEKHNGIILANSSVGVGSTFKIYFPLVNRNVNNFEASKRKEKSEVKRILIVDDNEEVIKVLKKGLQQQGYKVVYYTSPIQALKVWKANYNLYDIVITDFMMSDMRGNELAREMKAVKPGIPIILMTGYMDSELVEKDKDIFDGYLPKPIEISALVRLIKDIK